MGAVDAELRLLDLEGGASLEEVKQAYRDLVMVWHPDRFGHNPRLRQKAEAKIKAFNLAYAALKQWYDSLHGSGAVPGPRSSGPNPAARYQGHRSQSQRHHHAQRRQPPPPNSPQWRCGKSEIGLNAAKYVLEHYRFQLARAINAERREYLSGPFSLMVCDRPLEVALSVPCESLQSFDRILLSIPCKSTGRFVAEEAELLLTLLAQQPHP